MRIRQLLYIILIIALIIPHVTFAKDTIIVGDENINKLINEVDTLLKIKYTHVYEYGDETSKTNNVYKIVADEEIIRSTFDLKLKIEEYIVKQQVLDIQIIDKGHIKENDKILGKEYSKYDRYQTSEELYEIYSNHQNEKPIKTIEIFEKDNLKTNEVSKVEKVVVTLVNNQQIIVKKNHDKLDFTKYIDKNNNKVDMSDIDINTPEGMNIAKAVTNFEKAKELSNPKEFDIPTKTVANLKIVEEALIEEKKLDKFYNGHYTNGGKELINLLADRVFYNNGNKYNINYNLSIEGNDEEKSKNNISKIIYDEDKYSFDIKLNIVQDKSVYISGNQNFKLTINSNSHAKLNNFRKDIINAVVNSSKDMINRDYEIIGGNDRFETSVEVSREYTKLNSANGIVLVGEDAVVDGLSVAPFAKQKNSPILLTQKDEIPKLVMDEIKRVFNSFKGVDTVYIIGGEDVVSDKVHSQLVSELQKVKIIRIAGEDRYQTSINICNSMDLSSVDKAYIVGGDGEVDAMSISPLAVSEGVPIIVSPKDGITKDINRFIQRNVQIESIVAIGGTSVVDTQVLLDIKEAANSRTANQKISLNRVWGYDRHETNASVLGMYDDESNDMLIVAKDGMNKFSHLIDAMSASMLGYPIILSTDNITKEQLSVCERISNEDARLIQVGYGIDSKVIDKIVNSIS